MNDPLTDESKMPFGKFKGAPMVNVPADYLHWLWHNGKSADMQCPVADYIRRNKSGLELDNKDLIWNWNP